jgi:membrane-associated protease RseP (regulator of RpoE activity)
MFHVDLSAGLPVVQAKFADPKGKMIEGDFIVSTANDTTVVLFDRYAESRHILSSHWKTVPSIDPALNAAGIGAVGRVKTLELGKFMSQDMLATITKSDLPGSSEGKIAGIIGAAMLSRFTVVFDYPHQQIFLTPNARFNSDDQEDKSGISVVAEGNSLRVFRVVDVNPGSPGAKAGVQKGDVIAGIDDEPAADLTLSEIRSLFRQVGHKYNLAIERNGQAKQINVEMKRQLN